MKMMRLRTPIILMLILFAASLLTVRFGDIFIGSHFAFAAPAEKKDKKSKSQKKTATKARAPRVRKFRLNFNNVELNEFLKTMSQTIGKNIVIDEKVRGKVTIISSRSVPVTDAYNIMKSILELKGFAVVETKNLIKIVRVQDAIKKNVEIYVDDKKISTIKNDEKIITHIFNVKYATATDIMRTLRSLKSRDTNIVVYDPLNMLIFSGSKAEIDSLIDIARQMDVAEGDEIKDDKSFGNIHVIHLENANAVDLANVLSRVPFSETAKINTRPVPVNRARSSRKQSRLKQPTTRTNKQKLSIIANKETNSLVITATREELLKIKGVIKELDSVRDQVLIEALIIEVGADNSWGFGIDWMLGQDSGVNTFGGSNLSGRSYDFDTEFNGKTLPLPVTTGLQLGYIYDSTSLGFALLNASATDSNFNILSTPQILTIDNNEAELNVGEEIPIQTKTTNTTSTSDSFEFKPVGIKLKITPHITKKKQITLDLYQEINDVIGNTRETSGTLIPPTISKRDIKTKVTVHDGKTIVVGGLIKNKKSITETKVPLLGDIPILGWLFKHKSVSYSKINLLVFITPHIVTKQDKMDAVTNRKKNIQRTFMNRNK